MFLEELLKGTFPSLEVLLNSFDEKDLQTETFEVTKGNIKTIITYQFNKQGYPVSRNHTCEVVMTEDEKHIQRLNMALENAVSRKDYARAAELQTELKKYKGE